jgi:hypothetical protein
MDAKGNIAAVSALTSAKGYLTGPQCRDRLGSGVTA